MASLKTIAGVAAARAATILLIKKDIDIEKAIITNEDKGSSVTVMFNPEDYTYTLDAKLSGKDDDKDEKGSPGTPTPGRNIYFRGVTESDFEVTLFYDTYEKKTSVKKETDKIADLIKPTITEGDGKRPPICVFSWGDFSYRGIISKVEQKFTMFLNDGTPVRAEITLTFQSVLTEEKEEEFSNQGQSRKLWTVTSGDRLDLLAHQVFGDPSLWHIIAEANNIEHPMDFPTVKDLGTELVIPNIH